MSLSEKEINELNYNLTNILNELYDAKQKFDYAFKSLDILRLNVLDNPKETEQRD